MAKETITFEVVLHFGEGGYDDNINHLKRVMTKALFREIEELEDIEITTIESETQE